MSSYILDLRKIVGHRPLIQVGAGIGSHIGPNACGFVYVAE